MNIARRYLICASIALLICTIAAHSLHAQTWPARPITLVIGFASGTGEVVGRVFAEFASKQLGQPVLVETRPAGGGIVAAQGVAKAAPDGYTIGLQAVGPMILRPIMGPSVGYDSEKDFSPIVLVGDTPNVILGGTKIAARSVQETIVWAKNNPGHLTIGHPGPGTMGHLAALLLATDAGITATYISYRNVGQLVVDLLGGQIDIAVASYTPQQKSARLMAVMTADPVAFLPGVPSIREAGFPNVYASTWFGLFGPPNLPPEIVAKLNAVTNEFLLDPDAKTRLASLGFQTLGGSPGMLTKIMIEDKVKWGKIIKAADIKLNDPK